MVTIHEKLLEMATVDPVISTEAVVLEVEEMLVQRRGSEAGHL